MATLSHLAPLVVVEFIERPVRHKDEDSDSFSVRNLSNITNSKTIGMVSRVRLSCTGAMHCCHELLPCPIHFTVYTMYLLHAYVSE